MTDITPDPVNNPPDPAEDSRPDWLPENFATPEALAKSYRESQSALTRESQQRAEYERQLVEVAAERDQIAQQLQAAQTPGQEQAYDWDTLYDQNPLGTTALLIQQGIQQALAQQGQVPPEQQAEQDARQEAQSKMFAWQVDQMIAADPDVEEWESYREKVGAKINEIPGFLPQSSDPETVARGIKEAYRAVRYDELASEAKEGESVKDVAGQKRAEKMAAQTATSTAGRPETTESDEEWFASLKDAHDQSYSTRMGNKGL